MLPKRLTERSTTFRHLVDGIRQELAVASLKNRNLNLVDVAYLLGFAEQSAFQRAFRQWMQMTPREYRADHRSGRRAAPQLPSRQGRANRSCRSPLLRKVARGTGASRSP